jgi:hypothetical protein
MALEETAPQTIVEYLSEEMQRTFESAEQSPPVGLHLKQQHLEQQG